MIGWINLVIAGFNLIPALPMDGGRILRAALSKRMSFVRATDLSVTVARVVAVGFVIWALSTGTFQLLLLAPFLWIMGTREKQIARMMSQYDDAPRSYAPRFTITNHNGRIVIVPID
jgi:Zn-dependent protease